MILYFKSQYGDERCKCSGVSIPGQVSLPGLSGLKHTAFIIPLNFDYSEIVGNLTIAMQVAEARNFAYRLLRTIGEDIPLSKQ